MADNNPQNPPAAKPSAPKIDSANKSRSVVGGVNKFAAGALLAGSALGNGSAAQPIQNDFDQEKPTQIELPERAPNQGQEYLKNLRERGVRANNNSAVTNAASQAQSSVAQSAASNAIAEEVGGIDAQGAQRALSRAAQGDIKGAASEAVKVGEEAGTTYLFNVMMLSLIPSFGLSLLIGDIVWVISKINKFFSGKDIIQLVGWQKVTFAALNAILGFVILIILFTLWVYSCAGVSGFLLSAGGKLGVVPDICKPISNVISGAINSGAAK